MIYQLYCGLILTGHAACSTLLGSYMMHYAGAREVDLGFIFMIQPMTIFFRPLICAHADRRQSHKQMLAFYLLLTSLAYLPFTLYPFFRASHVDSLLFQAQQQRLETNELTGRNSSVITEKVPVIQISPTSSVYWTLIVFHLIGSVGWCGLRSLGDALAVNFAKRVGSDFARYRKYGSLSYGICNFGLGFINQNWLLPSFVPAWIVYSSSMMLLSFLIYSWPDEYFIMSSTDSKDESARLAYVSSLPTGRETMRHIWARMFCCCAPQKSLQRKPSSPSSTSNLKTDPNLTGNLGDNLVQSVSLDEQHKRAASESMKCDNMPKATTDILTTTKTITNKQHHLSVGQQARIFCLLLKRDFRVILYLLIILYGGLTGYSGPNFVFTYMNVFCSERGTCNGSQLAGLVMLVYCFVETAVYMAVDHFRISRLNRTFMLELTFVSLVVHYYFYAFLLEHLSPYWFLVESLHGIEYGISLVTSVELGYYFAREVELLLPELIERNIISPSDDLELVKVSLMATMSGCYTLAYDGLGTITGCLLYGIVLGHFGFKAMWVAIGSSAALGFVVILVGYTLGKCFKIRPEILRIRDRQRFATNV